MLIRVRPQNKIVWGIFIILFIINGCFKSEPVTHLKPEGVPETAFWRGGSMGGSWYDVVEQKSDTFRIKIYKEGNGKLASDNYYKVQKECQHRMFNLQQIKELLYTYGDSKIYLRVEQNGQYCYLEEIDK